MSLHPVSFVRLYHATSISTITTRRRLPTGIIVPDALRRLRWIFLITKSAVSSNPESEACAFESSKVLAEAPVWSVLTSSAFSCIRVVGGMWNNRLKGSTRTCGLRVESRVGGEREVAGRGEAYGRYSTTSQLVCCLRYVSYRR